MWIHTAWKFVYCYIPLNAKILAIMVCQKLQPPYAKKILALYGSHHELPNIHFCEIVSSRLHLMNCLVITHCMMCVL
jgi:hypothetical protein